MNTSEIVVTIVLATILCLVLCGVVGTILMSRFQKLTAGRTVRRYIYWKLNRNGLPEPDFTDTPHLYPHAHLVEIPIPEDVLACMAEFKNPSVCLVLDKFGKSRGDCHEGSVDP